MQTITNEPSHLAEPLVPVHTRVTTMSASKLSFSLSRVASARLGAVRGMARKPIVGGNWKCNPATASSLPELVSNFDGCAAYLDKCDVYVCPSNLHVALVKDSFKPGAAAASKNLWRTRL